jgi:hypothetical protein
MKQASKYKKKFERQYTLELNIDDLLNNNGAKQDLKFLIADEIGQPCFTGIINANDYESLLDAMEAEYLSIKDFKSAEALRGYSSYVLANSIIETILLQIRLHCEQADEKDYKTDSFQFFLKVNSSTFVETVLDIFDNSKWSTNSSYIYAEHIANEAFELPYTSTVALQRFHTENSDLCMICFDASLHLNKSRTYKTSVVCLDPKAADLDNKDNSLIKFCESSI